MHKSKVYKAKVSKSVIAGVACLAINASQVSLGEPNMVCLAADESTATASVSASNSTDEKLIRDAADKFVKAFSAGNVDAIVDMCADDCSFTNSDGVQFNGRDAIRKMYEQNFATFGLQPISLTISKISFPIPGVAIEDGQTSFTRSDTKSTYDVVHIKKDGTWKMLRISESNYNLLPAEELKKLDWMIGSWKLQGSNKSSYLRVDAINGGSFLTLRFSDKEDIKDDENVVPDQMQIIGYSVQSKDIVSWNFGIHGGFGYGHWRMDGDNWYIKTQALTHDGNESIADYIIKHMDKDHFSWQSLGRSLNGATLPNMEVVQATRRRADK